MANAKRDRLASPRPAGRPGLNRYLAEIKKFPILTPEEEYMLAKRWREHGDTEAAAKLVNSHLRLVAKIAMGYRGYGLPVSELISRRQYRPDAGREEVRARSRLPPRDLCDVVDPRLDPGIHPALVEPGEDGHHRGAEEAVLQPAPDEEPDRRVRGRRPASPRTSTKIATDLGVTEDEVISMNRRMAMGGDTSLNVPLKGDEGGESQWQDFLVDNGPLQDERDRRGRGNPASATTCWSRRWTASTTARSTS